MAEPAKSRGMIQMGSQALHDMLSLPEHYQVVGATSNLIDPHTVSILIDASNEEFKPGHIPVPIYQQVEIEGKKYLNLDHMDWWPQPQYPAKDLTILPRWLVDPADTRLPRTVKPFYIALLYQSMVTGSEKMEFISHEMTRLSGLNQPEVRKYLNLLRDKKLVLSWSSDGIPPRVRRWSVELVPGGALKV